MALCKRAFHLCSNHRLCLAKYRDLEYVLPSTTSHSNRHLSQALNSNLKRAFLVDTLALVDFYYFLFDSKVAFVVSVVRQILLPQVRGLEAQGVPSKQAEAITSAITEVLNDSLENVAHSFVSKIEMQKVRWFSFFFPFFSRGLN